jgi:hypothetical protein
VFACGRWRARSPSEADADPAAEWIANDGAALNLVVPAGAAFEEKHRRPVHLAVETWSPVLMGELMGAVRGCRVMGGSTHTGGGAPARTLGARVVYFKPSFLPAESSSIDSRMRRSRVSGRLAV